MTRTFGPDDVPGRVDTGYYCRRAAGVIVAVRPDFPPILRVAAPAPGSLILPGW